MKFIYEYRTKDNTIHNGVVSATSRDEAYITLKRIGIKPSRLSEAPGFFNKLLGKGKRWIAIVVLGVLLIVVLVVLVKVDNNVARTLLDVQNTMDVFDSHIRRQVIGDAAIIAEGVRTGWADIFSEEGDRFLASFAIPGETPAIRSTSVESLQRVIVHSSMPYNSNTSIESRQIIAMVEGMKEELRDFLRDGGTIAEYGRELVHRQEQEISYYQRVNNEISEAISAKIPDSEIDKLLRIRNEQLRKMGIKCVVLLDCNI